MNRCSASGECTSSASASPRSPIVSASPLPTATVFTEHADLRSNAGTTMSSSPVSRVLVVVASTIAPFAA